MARTLLASYPRNAHHYDEMLTVAGAVRPHWRQFFSHLDAVAPEEMHRRLDFMDRRIQENGVTYNVYADPNGADRPWALDPLPLIIAADEWRTLAAAVAQRATVLNAMLADLYGDQRLLAEGLLPPALVYGQHGYLWPCRGIRPPGGTWLHLYAVDLARSADGRWWVIADRTQSPSGAGYALENRLIISRVFPELFRDLPVQHLADFFRALQDGLTGLAPVAAGEQPHVVLLTPGPYNETYFEHTYLARYLGFPLVEGQDLTVRGDTVYLKTLRGLKRVHVILRRQDDAYCDPLELRGDSALGVAGLLGAVRAGRVAVANALGSGLLGSSAVMGFLPAICRRLLGEPLAMPSVGTWWCGERPAFDYVQENFDDLVIKPAYPTQNFDPVFGRELAGVDRAEMLGRIAARPHAYVAQELVNLSQAPTWSRSQDRSLLPRAVGLRVYAVATPEGYAVMPGGLARVSSAANALVISMQRGGLAKDAWVLTDGPVSQFSLLKPSLGVADLVRSGANLSSRVVENLFWLGRYSERFDATARLLRVMLARMLEAGGETTPALEAALDLAELLGMVPGTAGKAGGRTAGSAEDRLLSAIYDPEQAGSLAASIRHLLWSATHVRERLSLDHWHSLNRLQRDLQGALKRPPTLPEAVAFLDRALLVSSSLTGFAMDNMTMDDGWRFLIAGRHVERLDFLAAAIGQFLSLATARAPGTLEWLLELMDSIITYRSRYSRPPELLPVLDLIVFDESNPRAVLFQIAALVRYLEDKAGDLGEAPGIGLGEATVRLRATPLERFAGIEFDDCGDCPPCADLAQRLFAVAAAVRDLSNRLGMRFFTHVGDVSHQTLAL